MFLSLIFFNLHQIKPAVRNINNKQEVQSTLIARLFNSTQRVIRPIIVSVKFQFQKWEFEPPFQVCKIIWKRWFWNDGKLCGSWLRVLCDVIKIVWNHCARKWSKPFLGVGKIFDYLSNRAFFSPDDLWMKVSQTIRTILVKFCSLHPNVGAPACSMALKSYDWDLRNIAKISPKITKKRSFLDSFRFSRTLYDLKELLWSLSTPNKGLVCALLS